MNVCKQCGLFVGSRNIFCSQSCSAKYSNRFGNRPVSKNRKPCPDCGKTIRNKGTRTCVACHIKRQHNHAGSLMKKDVSRERISAHARRVLKQLLASCLVCGYDFAVEAAHIKPVKSFPEDATINEMNQKENLLSLCPNHHLEFDRGKLTLEQILSARNSNG